jgi:hypothetical protein
MLRKSILALLPLVGLSTGTLATADDYDDCHDEVAEFWYPENDSLPGSRMRCHAGKTWPGYAARPCAPSEPFIHRYHTAHYWPDPYRWQDRGVVRSSIEAQRAAGWMTATTLYAQHFNPETNELNESGRLHLRWILIHVPHNRRTTWVQAGDVAQVSQMRLASVKSATSEIFGNDRPPVMLRVCEPLGTPAQEIDMVRRAYLSSWPVPRIASKSSGQASNLGGKSLDAGESGP